MTDLLLSAMTNPGARRLIRTLGLPLPLPEPLPRDRGPLAAMPLEDARIGVSGAPQAELLSVVATTLARAGGSAELANADQLGPFRDAGEAFGRPPSVESSKSVHALVFDASAITTVHGLRALYEFFHERVSNLARGGRAVVLGRANVEGDVETAAAQAALIGFTKSLAKEVGRRGATANVILVERGAENRLEPVLRFFLEKRSAFVSAQPIVVSARARALSGGAFFVRPLDGKVVVVTGAARGIGESIATRAAAEGAYVVCVDRPEEASATSALARKIGGTALALDIGADNAPDDLVAALGGRGADVIVHNAGITRDKTLARMDAARWDQTYLVNLGAVVRTTDALLSRGVLRDGGRIIGLSSVAGIAGNVGQTNYAGSKAGVIGYVQALAGRVADRGITVNAIAPGFIETRMTAAMPTVIREAGRRLAALGQGGQPVDVAEAVVFLASPGAQGITASTLRVCGGALIGA